MASGVLFGLILIALLAAPLYASEIAGTGPADNHLTDRIEIDGRATDVVSLAGVPLVVVLASAIVDLVTAWLDPRVRA